MKRDSLDFCVGAIFAILIAVILFWMFYSICELPGDEDYYYEPEDVPVYSEMICPADTSVVIQSNGVTKLVRCEPL